MLQKELIHLVLHITTRTNGMASLWELQNTQHYSCNCLRCESLRVKFVRLREDVFVVVEAHDGYMDIWVSKQQSKFMKMITRIITKVQFEK